MATSELEIQTDMLQSAAFKQIQECGDIISSILILAKFIQENNVSVGFDPSKLRQIGLRSVDEKTSTYLWHLNALIAASSDFEHLLLGIEMMFDRFLGSRACFLKEREKRQKTEHDAKRSSISSVSNQMTTPMKKPKFLGNEIVSFVNSYYDDREDTDLEKVSPAENGLNGLAVVTEDVPMRQPVSSQPGNDENQNHQNGNQLKVEENEEFLQKYRGKLSSPISFRMRQQKRMMQSERRGSQTNSACVSMIDFDESATEFNIHAMADSFVQTCTVQPDVASPFDVNKFAKTVDLGPEEDDLTLVN